MVFVDVMIISRDTCSKLRTEKSLIRFCNGRLIENLHGILLGVGWPSDGTTYFIFDGMPSNWCPLLQFASSAKRREKNLDASLQLSKDLRNATVLVQHREHWTQFSQFYFWNMMHLAFSSELIASWNGHVISLQASPRVFSLAVPRMPGVLHRSHWMP